MGSDGTAAKMAALSKWIDDYQANAERTRTEALTLRLFKVQEEAGEVAEALIGMTGQNPRKGVTHTLEDVRKELLDVALTALGAVEHIDGNTGTSLAALHYHVQKVYIRAGLTEAGEW